MDEKKKLFPDILCSCSNGVSEKEKEWYYYPLIKICFDNIIQGKNATLFFEKIKVEKIVLYAVNDFSRYLCYDLDKENKISILYLCDQNAHKFAGNVFGKQVFDISYLCKDYESKNIDKIVVCNLLYENEIVEQLVKLGIALKDIILFPSILYYIEKL